MSTPNRTAINRANAQHSTGPKTEAGKQQSSLNALRHGLTGQLVVMPTEDLQAYQLHVNSFTDEYHPQGATESHLVQALADASWRLNRVAALETNLLTSGVQHGSSYRTGPPTPITDAMAIASSLESQSKALANLSMHTQRLSRQFERTVAQLRDLQKARRDREAFELEKLLEILEMYKDKGETYDAAADGFVFSEPQIKEAIRRRNRTRLFEEAYLHRLESADCEADAA